MERIFTVDSEKVRSTNHEFAKAQNELVESMEELEKKYLEDTQTRR